MHSASIGNVVDTDRHKFETFADALWWGIVSSLIISEDRHVILLSLSLLQITLCTVYSSQNDSSIYVHVFVDSFRLDMETKFPRPIWANWLLPFVLLSASVSSLYLL